LLKILLIAGKSPYLGFAYGLFLIFIFISIIYVRIAMTTHVLILLIFNFNLLPPLTVACDFSLKETDVVLRC
jgi:hypothetical protein